MPGVAMGVNEPWNDQLARAVDDLFAGMPGSNLIRQADIHDPVAADRQTAILHNPSVGVDGDDRPMKQQHALHQVPLFFDLTRFDRPVPSFPSVDVFHNNCQQYR